MRFDAVERMSPNFKCFRVFSSSTPSSSSPPLPHFCPFDFKWQNNQLNCCIRRRKILRKKNVFFDIKSSLRNLFLILNLLFFFFLIVQPDVGCIHRFMLYFSSDEIYFSYLFSVGNRFVFFFFCFPRMKKFPNGI